MDERSAETAQDEVGSESANELAQDEDRPSRSSTRPIAALLRGRRQLLLAFVLFALTCVSTTWVGIESNGSLAAGLAFSVPLMAILLAHEFFL
jgi:hypothetical protein